MANDNWFPTAELRFVERPVLEQGKSCTYVARFLQQKWRRYPEGAQREEKWHDVPLVEDAEL
jgi:hypothetical protein